MPGISRNDAAQDQQQLGRRRTTKRRRGINRPGGRGGGGHGLGGGLLGGGLLGGLFGLLSGLIGRHHAKAGTRRHRIGRVAHHRKAKGKGHIHRPRRARVVRQRVSRAARRPRSFVTGVFSVVTRRLQKMRLLG
jgi:hypothetical protein